MIDLDLSTIDKVAGTFMFPLFRVAAMLMVMPIIGSRTVPKKVRLAMAVSITFLLFPTMGDTVPAITLGIETWMEAAKQVAIGTMMGLVLYLMIEVFIIAAQLMSSQMGLGFANITDPTNGTTVVVVAQFYNILVILLFLSMNGHLVMFEILDRSFDVFPVGHEVFNVNVVWSIISKGSWLFTSALLLALPAVTALLIVNFSFGIMTKAAPQINVFSIGFPFTMLMGLFITWASLEGFMGFFVDVNNHVLNFMDEIIAEASNV
jgi:flagellar biosynthetic protein FliR